MADNDFGLGNLHRDRERAGAFGAVADRYDRVRPSYSQALVRDLLMDDPHDVLDVGCGTGKAGRLFAEHGLTVLGVEPDPAMAAVARAHGLDVEVADFEQWDDAGRRFDLLVSGQAWHWIDPEVGARRAREVLRPGGRIALLWNMSDVGTEVQAAFDTAYELEAPELVASRRVHGGRPGGRDRVVAALGQAGFVDLATRDYPWQHEYDRAEWLDLLSTFSDHQLLDDERRRRLLEGIGDVVDGLGGSVVASWQTHLITALAP